VLARVTAFPSFTQIPSRVPGAAWTALRVAMVASLLAVAALLAARPEAGLSILWGAAVPALPLLFLVAPGLWRNACPLAALNQVPRLLGFSRGLRQGPRLQEYSYVIGIAAFFALATLRKLLFNRSGPASAVLLLAAAGLAFAGGALFAGKSGWCSSLCPLLPVQRLYGQTPFAVVPNSHCKPCVGCAKNCYDFNPRVAYLADQHDADPRYAGYRRFFAGAFPGFIWAFFAVPAPPAVSTGEMLGRMALATGASVAAFHLLDTFLKLTPGRLTALFGGLAFNLFYWFVAPPVLARLGADAPAAVWSVRGALLAATSVWLWRTFAAERALFAQAASAQAAEAARLGPGASAALQKASERQVEVVFQPGDKRVLPESGRTLLEIAEGCGARLEAGCRMGLCGADPVAILEGERNLSPPGEDERTTLRRLGHAANTRMACCARVRGKVVVGLTPQKKAGALGRTSEFNPSVKSVVIIGNGVAGVSAADHIRRRHPSCVVHLVGREKHPFYNRMGISRLVYGRSAMQGLHLLPDRWFEERQVTQWLNTHAARIDLAGRKVQLATGDELAWDRLLIATGSSAFVPPIEGWGAPGCFVMRDADDAMGLRDWVQRQRCRSAVVAGGGLLGLEAAHALHQAGLKATVLERGGWLLHRQLDARGGEVLREYLTGLGLHILLDAEVAGARGGKGGAVERVVLRDGRELSCDALLVAAGIRPNVELARAAGIRVNRGVVVDAQMRTSAQDVYAAGDVAEFENELHGLWPVATEQAEVAGVSLLGGKRAYRRTTPATTLKVVGAELLSVGRVEPEAGDEAIGLLEGATRYRKLVVSGGRLVGAILIGHPGEAESVQQAVKEGRDVRAALGELRAGRWAALARAG
jgi:NADPH-dependent 2,4-dienoyl-CoA reductase/sulfur reductase-like enzyme/ferredoxin